MNTREIRELLRGHIDPRIGRVIIAQQEDIASLKQMVMHLAGMFDQVLNNQITQAGAVDGLRQYLPYLKAMRETNTQVGSDPSLTGDE